MSKTPITRSGVGGINEGQKLAVEIVIGQKLGGVNEWILQLFWS